MLNETKKLQYPTTLNETNKLPFDKSQVRQAQLHIAEPAQVPGSSKHSS